MITTKYTVNNEEPEPLVKFSQEPDFYQWNFKNVEYRHISVNNYCRSIIDKMMDYISTFKKYQYVFVQSLALLTSPAGLWHLDSSLNPVDGYENYLFVTGNFTTEFISNEMVINHATSAADFHRQVQQQSPIYDKIPSQTIWKYNGANVHRKPAITRPVKRLLIRLSNTDKELTTYK